MDLVKFAAGIVCLVMAVVFYSEVRGKKPLRMGDNQFFIEDVNRISSSEYYRSWRLVIVCFIAAVTLIIYSLNHN